MIFGDITTGASNDIHQNSEVPTGSVIVNISAAREREAYLCDNAKKIISEHMEVLQSQLLREKKRDEFGTFTMEKSKCCTKNNGEDVHTKHMVYL